MASSVFSGSFEPDEISDMLAVGLLGWKVLKIGIAAKLVSKGSN